MANSDYTSETCEIETLAGFLGIITELRIFETRI